MKVLNRPMFRMGGPIKEGIMSGIQEPRQGYRLGNTVDRTVGGAQMVFPAEINAMMPNASKVFADVSNIYAPPVDSNINTTDRYITVDRKKPRSNEIQTVQIENPDFVPKYKTIKHPRFGERKVEITEDMENITNKGSGTDMPPMLDQSGEMGAGTINNVNATKDNTDPTLETNKKERINTILEGLGYDRAQKNALYDAMIKAGQRISRTGLGAENLVSDVIAETSQSYDKPEKLREAANLMQVQQDLKLDQIKASKDTRSPIQKNADYFLESGVAKNTDDAIRMARNLPVTVSETFQTKVKEFGKSEGLVQTAIDLSERGQFGNLEFEGKIDKKYKGKPLSEFLGSPGFKGDGVYTADGKILVIQNGVIKQTINVRGSVEDSLFNFGGED